MAKKTMKFSLKELYAIKHALQLNILYKDLGSIGACGDEKEKLLNDIKEETKLLNKVITTIKEIKN